MKNQSMKNQGFRLQALSLKVRLGPPDGVLRVLRVLTALRPLTPSGTLAILCGSGANLEKKYGFRARVATPTCATLARNANEVIECSPLLARIYTFHYKPMKHSMKNQ